MFRSKKLFRIAGIDVFVHWTFVLLIGWVLLTHWLAGDSLAALGNELLFLGLLFGTVVLHELGHALAARRYGIPTRDITLLPIGGVARLERMPDQPRHELVVALAGPVVNVALVGLLLPLVWITRGAEALSVAQLLSGDLLVRLLWVNVSLAVFNLLPAFPMDGGRVLRALLAMRVSYATATRVAATIGQGLAVLLGIIGLLVFNPLLVLVAMFIGIGAAQENNFVQTRSALSRVPILQAMVTRFETLHPRERLRDVCDRVLDGFQNDFPVVEHGNVVGLVTPVELMRAVSQGGLDEHVSQFMRTDFVTTTPQEMLDVAYARMSRESSHALPVLGAGKLVGLVTLDNLSEFLMLQETLREVRHPAVNEHGLLLWRTELVRLHS